VAAPASVTAPPAAGSRTLTAEQRERIDAVYAGLGSRSAFELLEVERTVDARGLKRAYFRLSKEFHPDRYYGKELGEYGARLSEIFFAMKVAFELLSDGTRRAEYEATLPR
jgi:DnaJ-class molecular chaperone